jgi:hypothetical protein
MRTHHRRFQRQQRQAALVRHLSPPFVHCFLRRNRLRLEAIRRRLSPP